MSVTCLSALPYFSITSASVTGDELFDTSTGIGDGYVIVHSSSSTITALHNAVVDNFFQTKNEQSQKINVVGKNNCRLWSKCVQLIA